jgi:uncharacterized protein with GYD domain
MPTTPGEQAMPKYLIEANYVGEGIKGLLKDGGSGRLAAIEQLAKSMGGTLETAYFAFGDTDIYVIVDLPDNASAAAISLTVSSTGLVTTKTIVLMTPAEVDEAVKKHPSYRAPGQ